MNTKHAESAARLGALMSARFDAFSAIAPSLLTDRALQFADAVGYCIDAPREMPAGASVGCTRGASRFALQVKTHRA